MSQLVHVVAAVILNEKGEFLLSSRPEGKAYAGYWEFAGGKVEAGETELAALKRELNEELGIHIQHGTPWLTKIHHYEHASVLLRFFRVLPEQWHGTPHAREQQQYSWQQAGRFDVSPMLPANGPILRALSIPLVLHGSRADGWQGQNGVGCVNMHIAADANVLLLQDAVTVTGQGLQLLPLDASEDWTAAVVGDGWWWQPRSVQEVDAMLTKLHQGSALPIVALLSPDAKHTMRRLQDAGVHIAQTTDLEVFLV